MNDVFHKLRICLTALEDHNRTGYGELSEIEKALRSELDALLATSNGWDPVDSRFNEGCADPEGAMIEAALASAPRCH